ncbi:ATP-dependent DNA helicase [Diaphorobacter sp.]|uniref:ATP-dependent DNA helicase n=1 Tax=Diaphorobacter sp. TaxID=1934310 RepID=UPI003918271D
MHSRSLASRVPMGRTEPLGPASYTIAVRELCAFTAKAGDLDVRFTPAPTSQEGIEGHGKVTAKRPAQHYETEIALCSRFQELQVRGRADGFDASIPRLEEIKTHKGRLDRQPPAQRALHWAQARVYGWLMCEARGFAALDIALVYFDIDSERETVFTEHWSAADLRAFFETQCARFIDWARKEAAHRLARDAALQAWAFPYGAFRSGQRDLAENVYRAAMQKRVLLAQAPTGIGKTMGTLFPTLKALPARGIDKVFYLAAKTSGRQLALDAMRAPVAQVRVLELVARDKACEHPDKACHGESCPLARGFYDRLAAARTQALEPGAHLLMDQRRVRDVALAHDICPYYLSQELVRWADMVVGDYNYYFDFGGLLHSLTAANDWTVALLVDEAHNLVDRARGMYSAALQPESLRQARDSATAAEVPRIKKALAQVRRAWSALNKEHAAEPYVVFDALPPAWSAAVSQSTQVIGEHFADHPDRVDADLQTYQLEALQLLRLMETLDAHSIVDLQQRRSAQPDTVVSIRNVVPAPFLQSRWEAAHSVVLFSATLQPAHFYAQLLGLPPEHVVVDIASPFSAEQLQVRVARSISTRYAHRAASAQPVADLMARQFRERPGNYLAFFSSYEYLELVADHFALAHPHITQWRQARGMREEEQRAFLARFTQDSQGIGFAVLGGAFAEGIDLTGERLIGAFLATLGLPQFNPVNEHLRKRMQELFGAGYDFTYLYPGLQKVVQAAGRVIRTPQDRGVVHLIDDRFARAEVRRLLPVWWQVDIA